MDGYLKGIAKMTDLIEIKIGIKQLWKSHAYFFTSSSSLHSGSKPDIDFFNTG